MTKSGLNDVITDEAEGEGRTDIRILREKKRSPSYQYEKRSFGKVNTVYAGFFGAGGVYPAGQRHAAGDKAIGSHHRRPGR